MSATKNVRDVRATVKDVARLANVSPKTVSNVINGTSPVSAGIRERVEKAMLELDYVPNLSARGLRNGRSGVIALALPNLSTPYSAELAHHFVAAAGKHELSVQFEESALSDEKDRMLVSRARAHLLDGLILNPMLLETAVKLQAALPPTVFIGEVDQDVADHVWIDNVAASADITKLLLELGHRRIACLGVMRSETSRLRLKGYRQALSAAGVTPSPTLEISNSVWTPAGAAAVLRSYLEHHELPEAIVCFTDSQAIGVLSALWTLGHRVPDDISVVGYDGVADAEYASPPIATVTFDKQAYTERVLELLTARIADPRRSVRRVITPYRIVSRQSVAPR